jgi:predicted HTH transcriptional regulator
MTNEELERLTRADYRRLNPGIDSVEATRDLLVLVQRGLLQQHGARRWTHYTLALTAEMPPPASEPEMAPPSISEGESASQSVEHDAQSVEYDSKSVEHSRLSVELVWPAIHLAQRAAPHEVREAILSLCRVAPLTSKELAERLRRDRTYLLNRYLSALVTEGLLERVGAAPTDPHVRYRAAGHETRG